MSRIGKLPIPLPKGVTVSVSDKSMVKVKGPLGELERFVNPCIKVNVDNEFIRMERHTDQKDHRSLHGLYRSLLANMITGVSTGFKREQEFVGVGYKVSAVGQVLELVLGYSHHIFLELPKEIKIQTTAERGKNQTLILESIDNELLGMVTAKIRSFRKPEPYKGKGVKFVGEVLRRKAGKSAASAK